MSAVPWTSLIMVALLLVAAYSDLRWRRLPNWLTLGGAIAGVALNVAMRGLGGGLDSLIGWLAGCALLFLPFALGGMGAGDVKLLAAVGALEGVSFVLSAAVYMAFVGGALAVVVLIKRGTLLAFGRTLVGGLWFALRCLVLHGMLPPVASFELEVRALPEEAAGWPVDGARAFTLPYGVPIAAGAVLRLVLGY